MERRAVEEFELADLDQVDDLLVRPSRSYSKGGSSCHKFLRLVCSKVGLRWFVLCLFSLVIGAAIGHVTVRSRTTDATSYAEAKAGDEYTTRFIVVGDWGRQGQYHQQDVAMQMALVGAMLRPQFVISTGDNFYPSGLKRENDTQIFDSFTGVYEYPSLKGPWYSVLGNHDYGDGSAKNDFATRPDLQSSEWMIPLDSRWVCCGGRDFTTQQATQDLDLFFLDTSPFLHKYHTQEWATVRSGILDQKDKVEDQVRGLDVELGKSLSRWKIVVGHHPVFSNGRHGDTPELVSAIPPLLRSNKVDFYISGHEHDLQDIQDPQRANLRYITSGAGSKTRLESGYGHNKANFFSMIAGFVTIALSENKARVQFWLYDATLAYEYILEKN